METRNGKESHSQGGIPNGEEGVQGPESRAEEKGSCPKTPSGGQKANKRAHQTGRVATAAWRDEARGREVGRQREVGQTPPQSPNRKA